MSSLSDGSVGKARIPYGVLSGLSAVAFLAIMTETVPAGLLSGMAMSFSSSAGMVGQYLTAYAVGSMVAAIPVMASARRVSTRKLLVAAVAVLATSNLLTALNSNIIVGIFIRLVAGMAGGVAWGLLANQARGIVPNESQGRALAIVSFGQPLALTLGVPLGSWLGDIVGWRGVFTALAIAAGILTIWMYYILPSGSRSDSSQGSIGSKVVLQSLRQRGVIYILVILSGWICGHNALYAYLDPFIADIGLNISTGSILLMFGGAATVSIIVAALTVDHATLPTGVLCGGFLAFGLIAISLSNNMTTICLGVVFWGLGFGAAPTVLQTGLGRCAKNYIDIAQALFVTVFNFAIALGGFWGSVIIDKIGLGGLPLFSAVVCSLALGVVLWKPDALRSSV